MTLVVVFCASAPPPRASFRLAELRICDQSGLEKTLPIVPGRISAQTDYLAFAKGDKPASFFCENLQNTGVTA